MVSEIGLEFKISPIKDQDDTCLRFTIPLLLVVLTIKGEDDGSSNLKLRLDGSFSVPQGHQ